MFHRLVSFVDLRPRSSSCPSETALSGFAPSLDIATADGVSCKWHLRPFQLKRPLPAWDVSWLQDLQGVRPKQKRKLS